MREEEVVFLVLFLVFLPAFIVHKVISYKKWQAERRLTGGGDAEGSDALTTTELRAIVESAVIEATQPLQQQLDTLEMILLDRQAPEALPAAEPRRLVQPDASPEATEQPS